MKRYIAPLLLLSFILIAEIVSYFALRRLFKNRRRFNFLWWAATISLYAGFFATRAFASNYIRNWYINGFTIILITKFVVALFYLIFEFIRKSKKAFKKPSEEVDLSRREFNSKMALGLATIPFFSMHWGLFRTAYNFKLHTLDITIPSLPKVFKGFKIVQLSDIHTGSLQNHHQLQKAMELAMEQKADLICFTGDLVNNRTDEVYPYIDDLKKLNAPYGVISILGNHDYGDYETWKTETEKEKNLIDMHHVHRQLGWRLLLNENISIEKEGKKIHILGVDNWGANLHFPKYGKLDEAYKGLSKDDIKILLSHD